MMQLPKIQTTAHKCNPHELQELREQESLVEPQASHAAHEERNEILRRFFSDETEAFRSPAEPGVFQWVAVRLRVEAGLEVQAALVLGESMSRVPMACTRADAQFSWHEARFRCGLEPLTYRISIDCGGERFVYQKDGAHRAEDELLPTFDFRVMPGFHTPAWAKGALQYQIFPDRFANGNPENDVTEAEYAYNYEHVRPIKDWDAPPEEDDYRCFYGGDLKGVVDKLDYLQALGVEAIYLNPIFVSPSSHKYDTQDYEHVDPHLGIIADDVDCELPPGVCNNEMALRYVRRTTSQENLERSDALFAELCREIHRRGMRVILDGVFNHCGSFSRWMDREGVYRNAGAADRGAYRCPESPYHGFFDFKDAQANAYEGWWNYFSLPKLNYENAPDLAERVLAVARKWAMPPYSIDGWRLDVAADLGHSEDYNHAFWRRFRDELKRVNPELLIVAEHYGDASPWLGGDQWDTVMNYDAFMDPLSHFLTGMEKHSDRLREDLYQDGAAFWEAMLTNMSRFGGGSLLCTMNELSNHDHSRFLTRTNRTVGRLTTAGSAAAGEGIDKRVMCEAVTVQMTWPGAPTIYYGDEAGQVGWTDPDCRRTYPWGSEDEGLIELHRELARVRAEHPSLRDGSFVPLGGGCGWIAYGRFSERDCGGDGNPDSVAVVCNNLDEAQTVRLRLRTLGVPDGRAVAPRLRTTDKGFAVRTDEIGRVSAGVLAVRVPARAALVLVPRD